LYEGEASAVLARLDADARRAQQQGQRVGILAADEDALHGSDLVRIGSAADLSVVATRLYAGLRELDARGVDLILARGYSGDTGLAVAIQDRLRRAAAGRVIRC
jgi:L-threonylcarbamoyladenylate synthase